MPGETPPSIKIPRNEQRIAFPIAESGTLDVKTTPLFVDELPIVDSIDGIPIGTDTYGKRTETIIVDEFHHSSSTQEEETNAIIARISRFGRYPHNRSFNWMEQGALEPQIIKIHGREYSGISTKGGDFRTIHIERDDHFPSGIRIFGALTEDDTRTLVKNSKWLLANGIDSEVIWSVSRLDELPGRVDPKIKRTPQEVKRTMLDEAEAANAHLQPDQRVDLTKAGEYLGLTNFVVINRATTVPFRLSDLIEPTSQNEFYYMVNYMMSYLNRKLPDEDKFHYLIPPAEESDTNTTNINNNTEIMRFFTYFGKNLGTQIGKLHGKGVIHGFLHSGNISGDGTFVDLDSLSGKPLNGIDITAHNIAVDISRVLGSIKDVTSVLETSGRLPDGMQKQITQTFLQEYTRARYGSLSQQNIEIMNNTLHDVLSLEKKPKTTGYSPKALLNYRQQMGSYRYNYRWLKEIQDSFLEEAEKAA